MENSFIFSSIIRQLPPCVDSQFLVSFDITSLFTNVPLDEVISICADLFILQSVNIGSRFPWKCFHGIDGIGYQVSFLPF